MNENVAIAFESLLVNISWYLQRKQEYDEEKFTRYRTKKAADTFVITTALQNFGTWDELAANVTIFFQYRNQNRTRAWSKTEKLLIDVSRFGF